MSEPPNGVHPPPSEAAALIGSPAVAIAVFPGSNCHGDVARAIEAVSGIKAIEVWHRDRLPSGTRLAIIPGGFSFGDYLRAGAIATTSPVMKSVAEFAAAGGHVLGYRNGSQVLLEAGLLPGAMLRNAGLNFICRDVHVRVARRDSIFTSEIRKDALALPIAHGQGNYFIPPDGLRQLVENHQVVFRYCDESGQSNDSTSPNGSVDNIAGVCNLEGNVLGMMPHPERASEECMGSTDGAMLWRSAFHALGLSTTPS